jgi:colicin import membrane protein
MEIAPNIRDRIFAAADTLYRDTDRQTFPTVDAVRKLAKVNMNDASTGMKAWRRSQLAQITPMAVQVPAALQQSTNTALVTLWSEAVAIANETLRTAQAGWEAERAEAEALREQVANAYEAQASDLAAAHAEISRLQAAIERNNRETAAMQARLDATLCEAAIADTAKKLAETRVAEIERRAADLRNELDHSHNLAVEASKDRVAIKASHRDEVTSLRQELTQSRQKAEAEGATAQGILTQALEAAALLRAVIAAVADKNVLIAAKQPTRKKSNGAATKEEKSAS